MKFSITKYLILILIAFFFASTNELSAKEAEHYYFTESHSFLDTGNYTLNISFDKFQKDLTKTFHAFSSINYPDTCISLINLLALHRIKNISPLISNPIYLENSTLRI